MPPQIIKLGDILGITIAKNGAQNCLAKTSKEDQCRRRLARSKCDLADDILQHKMSFLESEHDLILKNIKSLVDLLFIDNHHPPTIVLQKSEQEQKWLDLWREEHQAHQLHPEEKMTGADGPEQPQSESLETISDNEENETTHIPAIIRYPTLPLETPPGPVPTNASLHTTAIYSPLNPFNHTTAINPTEEVSHQISPIAATEPDVLEHDVQLATKEASSRESLGMSVFFSPNQLAAINMILQYALQLCAFFRVQYGTFLSRDGAGNTRTESFLQCQLNFCVRLRILRLQVSPWVTFPLFIAFGQAMYMLTGSWLSMVLSLFVTLVAQRWSDTQENESSIIERE
ncbi:hypothetical protein N7520_003598 [Penicillium odoratum]|uniref:uncharacterized protein n=1 Tax=Penicillium odoratum TaxID=1167516 RepID=UPI002548A3EF|nr:uncharacterized protein N7520_003598 [Penicillium odoratum]KAJ5769039.1 hypothetical protein N7520_003598 [Penicillium odoratum]